MVGSETQAGVEMKTGTQSDLVHLTLLVFVSPAAKIAIAMLYQMYQN